MVKTPETVILKQWLLQLVETCPSFVTIGKSPSLVAAGNSLRPRKGTRDCKPVTMVKMVMHVERK